MAFKELNIKSCYESSIDDIVEDFYEPVLKTAIKYDRIAGFFSSSSLAVAARGIASFIVSGGSMRLITSPRLSAEDISEIKNIEESVGKLSISDVDIPVSEISDMFVQNHVKALGWMLEHGLLEIKFAIVFNEDGTICDYDTIDSLGLFHQKVGIFTDELKDSISFSGSINETASAWVHNDEEFKVFHSWDETSIYYRRDCERFDEIWSGSRKGVRVFDLPSAIRNELISYSSDFKIESIALEEYKKVKAEKIEKDGTLISLFPYQSEALKVWRQNGCNLLFEMATGTGKTRTAIAGMSYLFAKYDKIIAIVSCPQNTLAKQWMKEVNGLKIRPDISVIVDGTNPKWRKDFNLVFLKIKTGLANKAIVYTVHNTSSSEDFISIVRRGRRNNLKVLFIGDEAHWLGAQQFRKALLPEYDYRIGLSATPSRWFDDCGTKVLTQYFGDRSFEFSIKDALNEINPLTNKHFLVNYYYHILKVSLTCDEALEYKKICERLSKLYFAKDNDPETAEKYDRLLEKRADIIRNAEEKYSVISCLIKDLKERGELEDTIVFVSPQQKQRVLNILAEQNIISHKLTQDEGTKAENRFGGVSEREYIIQKFISKDYKVLVAIKCLDEGIDIPSASRGILMASSTNPREYIQRIGRIIRQSKGKGTAHLYDIYVSQVDGLDIETERFERRIREKEKIRLKEIAENAINYAEVINVLTEY